MTDISSLLARIEVARQRLRHLDADIDSRLLKWGVRALLSANFPVEDLLCLLLPRSPNRQWWLVRQFLSEDALITLEEKLKQQLSPSAMKGEKGGER